MRLLIDTQALICFVENDKKLPMKIKETLTITRLIMENI